MVSFQTVALTAVGLCVVLAGLTACGGGAREGEGADVPLRRQEHVDLGGP